MIQSFYRRCMCAGLCSVSLLVVEQKELSVCVILKKCLAWSKEMMLALIGLYTNHKPFFQLSQHQEQGRAYGNAFALCKALKSTKNSSSSSSLRFLTNEANRKIEETAKKLVLMTNYFNIWCSKL